MMESTMIERVAQAIEQAQIGYSISMVRLVDGVATFECRVDGVEGVLEFDSHAEALEFVTARQREFQARAAIEAMSEPTKLMLSIDGHGTPGLKRLIYCKMINAALTETPAAL